MGFECLYKYKYIDKYYLYIVFQRYVLAHTIITKRSWLVAHTIVLVLRLTSFMPSIPPSIPIPGPTLHSVLQCKTARNSVLQAHIQAPTEVSLTSQTILDSGHYHAPAKAVTI